MTHKEYLDSLNKNEKRFLSKYKCAWCDHPLEKDGCSDYNTPCSDETRITRFKKCMALYKPRKRKGKKSN